VSADYWVRAPEGHEWASDEEREDFEVDTDCSLNVTYNLGPMLRAAGFPQWDRVVGAPCSELGGTLEKVRNNLAADLDWYQAEYGPENGWGNATVALTFVRRFRDLCARYPWAVVEAWL